MAITASLVKELRERTGAGMMECKKALVEAGGDIEVAIEAMRKAGQAKAAKKAGRVAAEGAIITMATNNHQKAVILEINCETDFVAKDEQFRSFANQVAELILANDVTDPEAIKDLNIDGKSVEQVREALVSKIGENIQVRRAEIINAAEGGIYAYVHSGRIGVLVSLSKADAELGQDLAMHIAASNPEYVDPSEVPADRLEKEKDIFRAQALQEGKPAEIVEKMIEGRVKKQLNEICLIQQEFVKDPDQKVGAVLSAKDTHIAQFLRFELGEGIEKKVSNFAEEVKAQVEGA